jgi:signal transduction histidine kinase
MKKRQSVRPPSFYRQGLLIVLPALILAGIGLLSLRQDRQLAQLEATDQAKKLARSMREVFLPDAFRLPLSGLEGWHGLPPVRFKPREDPLWLLSEGKIVACLLDRSGALVHPPPRMELPEPLPLPVEDLDEARRQAWQSSQELLHENTDPIAAIRRLQELADAGLPEPMLAMASYQLGVLWQDAGNASRASQYFDSILSRHPAARSDSGASLRTLSAMRLLQLSSIVAPDSRRDRELAALIGWDALFEPTLLSRFYLDAFHENEPWLGLWRCHEKSRALYDYLESEGAVPTMDGIANLWKWATLSDKLDYLLMSRPAGGQTAILGVPWNGVETLLKQALTRASPPTYLGIQIDVAERSFLALSNAPAMLEDTALIAATNGGPFRVRVFLSDTGALYARQRIRTLWFGGLIGVSVASVLLGLFVARRAFHRQRELSEMKTNFVSSVSHELRAPIASVRLMAEELEDIENPQKNREYKRFIVQECGRLSGLIENVLDFARHEQGRKEYEFESTDLEALVRETTRLMRAYAADKNIAVQTVILGEAAPVEADGRAIQQVLVNLIDNAIKHSPPNAEIEAGLEFAAERVRLWVQDHGEGIPPEDHARIFERFYRRGSEMRRKTQGVGLGLAIVKYVTEAHGGTVTVDSQLGRGSRFTVILPTMKK